MDYQNAKLLFDIIQTLLIAAIGIMNWLNNRQRVTTAAIAKLENGIDGRLDDQSTRLTRVEQDLKHAPTRHDFLSLTQHMDALNGELKEMKGEMHGVKTTLHLIHQYLLDRNNGPRF